MGVGTCFIAVGDGSGVAVGGSVGVEDAVGVGESVGVCVLVGVLAGTDEKVTVAAPTEGVPCSCLA